MDYLGTYLPMGFLVFNMSKFSLRSNFFNNHNLFMAFKIGMKVHIEIYGVQNINNLPYIIYTVIRIMVSLGLFKIFL